MIERMITKLGSSTSRIGSGTRFCIWCCVHRIRVEGVFRSRVSRLSPAPKGMDGSDLLTRCTTPDHVALVGLAPLEPG